MTDQPTHLMVAGYSRSGTTMFYEMLRRSVSNLTFLDHEMAASAVIGNDKQSYVTKRPLDVFNVEQMFANNLYGKQVSAILMIRDIRDVMTSFHKLVPDDYFIGYDHQYFINMEKGEASFTNPGILQIHQAIRAVAGDQRFRKVLVIRYEDVVSQPEEMQKGLAEILGFSYKDSFTNFHRYQSSENLSIPLNGARPPDTRSIAKWKKPEHRERIIQQFSECPALFDILIEYGYEQDTQWYEGFQE